MSITKATSDVIEVEQVGQALASSYTMRITGSGVSRTLELVSDEGGGGETVVSSILLTALYANLGDIGN